MKLADARRLATVMRSVRSFYIRYRLAAAHVHCTRPVGHGTDSLIFCLDRCNLLIIKENKHRMPGEASNLEGKSVRNQSLSAVGLFELPRMLPMPIARCDGTAWHPVSSPEHAR